MTQDYRPECQFCNKKLNKKERTTAKQTNLTVCKKCDSFLTKIIMEAYK